MLVARVGARSIGRLVAEPRRFAPVAVTAARRLVTFLDDQKSSEHWPESKNNTLLNVCPQGQMMVVERLGKFHRIAEGGYFFSVPFVDEIRFVIDMREKALAISPQTAITKDNVHVSVSGNLFCQFVDATKAAYGSKNPLYSVRQHAQSAMRAAIGEMELDEILHARVKLNENIKSAVQQAAEQWGLEIKRYEITEITPDRHIMEAMDKQAAAERERRKRVIDAEGDKRAAELESEGQKIRLKNESEGELIRQTNEAEASKCKLQLEGEGVATAILLKAKAQADAINILAQALKLPGGHEAAKIFIAKEYIHMYGEMAAKSNTMIFSDRPADINALMAQATAVMNGIKKDDSIKE